MIRVLAALAVVGVIAGGCASQPPAPQVATPAPPPAPAAPAPFSDRELADELVRQGVGVPKDAPTTPPRPGEDIPTEIRQTPRGVVVTSRNVLFAFDSDALTPQARREIERMAFVLNHPQAAARRITLEGHTDAIGTEAYNLDSLAAPRRGRRPGAGGARRPAGSAHRGRLRQAAPAGAEHAPRRKGQPRRARAESAGRGGPAGDGGRAMMTIDFAADRPTGALSSECGPGRLLRDPGGHGRLSAPDRDPRKGGAAARRPHRPPGHREDHAAAAALGRARALGMAHGDRGSPPGPRRLAGPPGCR